MSEARTSRAPRSAISDGWERRTALLKRIESLQKIYSQDHRGISKLVSLQEKHPILYAMPILSS
ncbi:hypothetical protein T01_2798 [Trichinella spiralis]|uniref:Uncharacterized protein n=1 Tax=Trichinella spiralis TaxID=6334 RepID=A0A0V1AMQ5_TRISP|nr:hypothetical protein T01_2798 [Trichinella spiralis]